MSDKTSDKNDAYENNIFKKIKEIEASLYYYIEKNKILELENKILREAYENRVNEEIKRRLE